MKKLTAITLSAGIALMASGTVMADGAATYKQACFACHDTGAANSPKIGDKAAWGPRIAQGKDALYASAINGKNTMPPKGGRADLSDDAVKAAVDYIIAQSK